MGDVLNAILDNRITGWTACVLLLGVFLYLVVFDKFVSKKRMTEAVEAEKRVTAIYQERGDLIVSIGEDIVIIGENLNKVLKALPTPKEAK